MREDESLPVPIEREPSRAHPLIAGQQCGENLLISGIVQEVAEPDVYVGRSQDGKGCGCGGEIGRMRHHSIDKTHIARITPMIARLV